MRALAIIIILAATLTAAAAQRDIWGGMDTVRTCTTKCMGNQCTTTCR